MTIKAAAVDPEDTCRQGELAMQSQFRPPATDKPNRCALQQMHRPGDQGADDTVAVFAANFDPDHDALTAFD